MGLGRLANVFAVRLGDLIGHMGGNNVRRNKTQGCL